ncbi:unnamed protein product [Urochloa humidicola]
MDDFFEKFDKDQWRSRLVPTELQRRELRLNGWNYGHSVKQGLDFFDWFKDQCMQSPTIHSALRQMSYGFCTRVHCYGCYDVNGYRFRSELYESGRSGLTTYNSGVCVSSYDESGNILKYYGIIEDIIKIVWEGSLPLELVLFYCRWFDPTTKGLRRTENLGLLEIKHTSRLSNFDPFVMANQVSQVYYLPYACKKRADLRDWWVVFKVAPHGHIPPNNINVDSSLGEGPSQDGEFYQEDGLDGTFVIDLDDALDCITPLGSDEITDPMDLETLEKTPAEFEEEIEATCEEIECTDAETESMDEEDDDEQDEAAYD